jgi:hypothetical protein
MLNSLISLGLDKGCCCHELFLRGKRFLSQRIHRIIGEKPSSRSLILPDFYMLRYLPESEPKNLQVEKNLSPEETLPTHHQEIYHQETYLPSMSQVHLPVCEAATNLPLFSHWNPPVMLEHHPLEHHPRFPGRFEGAMAIPNQGLEPPMSRINGSTQFPAHFSSTNSHMLSLWDLERDSRTTITNGQDDVSSNNDEKIKELVVQTGDFQGFVEVQSHHTLRAARSLLSEDFDDDMLPQGDFFFCFNGVRITAKQELRKKAWEFVGKGKLSIHTKKQPRDEESSQEHQEESNNEPRFEPETTIQAHETIVRCPTDTPEIHPHLRTSSKVKKEEETSLTRVEPDQTSSEDLSCFKAPQSQIQGSLSFDTENTNKSSARR